MGRGNKDVGRRDACPYGGQTQGLPLQEGWGMFCAFIV